MHALTRHSCIWGAVLLIIGCGTDAGEPSGPGDGSENRGGSAAGGNTKNGGSPTNEGGKPSTGQSTGTGKGGTTEGSQKGGSTGSGGTTQGKGGSTRSGTSGIDGAGGSTAKGSHTGKGGSSAGSGGSTGPVGAAAGGSSVGSGGSNGAGDSKGTGGSTGTGGKTSGGGGKTSGTGGSTSGGTQDGGTQDGGTVKELSCSGPALTGGTQTCSSNKSGDIADGYSFQIWSSGSGGCITTYGVGAAFKATWNNSGDFLARAGLGWDETKTYDQYGTIVAEYAYKKSGNGGGYSYIGIYGWSNDPLVEYYIVDDWLGSKYVSGSRKGSFTVDGGTYDIYQNTRTNQPSIHGTATFQQFFSFRTQARQCGRISISEHFKKWESLGMKMGKMYEARILVEAGGGSGSVDFSYATVTTSGKTE